MKWQIRRCTKCKEYTLNFICSRCKIETETPIPPKFSMHDKYARYRIESKNHEKNDENSSYS